MARPALRAAFGPEYITGQGALDRARMRALAFADPQAKQRLEAIVHPLVGRAIAKAVEAFQRDKTKCPVFKPRGAITYDQRLMGFKGLTIVSLWVLAKNGRIVIPFVLGEYQKQRMGRVKGQADLVYRQSR